MNEEFLINGHCVWNRHNDTKGMTRLRIAKNLAKRLFEDEHDTHSSNMNHKWGPIEMNTVPKGRNYRAIFSWPNARTKKENWQVKIFIGPTTGMNSKN